MKTDREKLSRKELKPGIKFLFSRIGFKLILIILTVLILSMGSLIYLATDLVSEFGEYAASVNEKNIKEKTTLLLSRIMDEQAMRYENIFSKVGLSSAVIAQQAGILLEEKQVFSRQAQPVSNLFFYSGNRFFSNPASDPFAVLYWGDEVISPEIRRKLNRLSNIGTLLETVKEGTSESEAVYVVTESNLILYYPNIHLVEKLKPIREYDLKRGIWYQMATPENNPGRSTLWTRVYQDEAGQGFMTTAVTPIYSRDGLFRGVAGIDVTLNKIIRDILRNNSLASDPGIGMFSFIVDEKGRIVAFPGDRLEMFGLGPEREDIGYGHVLEQSLMDSKYEQVRSIRERIVSEDKQTSRMELNHSPLLISSQIMPSTGWVLCMVIPESYILSSVKETRDSIDLAVGNMNYRFREMTLVFLVICVVSIVIFLSKQVIIPLNRLILGAGRVKEGDLTVCLDHTSRDEMGVLIHTFNTMVAELQKSSIREKEQTKILELKVNQRTWEIFQKNKEQAHTLALLEKESRDRNKIQNELRESQAQYRDIFQNSVEGIFQSTPDNRLLNANPAMARIWGYDSPKEMLDRVKDIETLYRYPEQRKEFIRTLEKKQTISGFEFQGIKKDKSVFWTSLSARAVVDPKGSLLYILGSSEDITERKQAEDAVRAASKVAKEASLAKSRFLATMSHEIRTPMNAIMGMTDLVLKTDLDREQKQYLEVVNQSSEHLLSLIDDILDISAIEAKKVVLEHRPLDLDQLMREVVNMFSARAGQQGIGLAYAITGLPVFLKGDAHRLRQVMVNLVNNALKFTQRGAVKILAEPDPEKYPDLDSHPEDIPIRFSVQDTGIGIPEKEMDLIFTEFTQLESSLSRTYGGTGLGLAICRRLVTLMGGKIRVESTESRGTTFYFTVTLQRARQEDIPKVEPMPSGETGALEPLGRCLYDPTCRILVAEDFEVNQAVIRPVLEKHGFAVTLVENGQKAVEAVRENAYDLILMDVQMPVMDGLEATSIIRNLEDPDKSKLPIIALTAHALKEDRERFLAAGMDEYISKPVRGNELITAISTLLSETREKGEAIDFDFALSLTDHDPELLLTLCDAILTHLPAKLDQLEQARVQGEYASAARLAHALKTAAKSLGAGKMADIALAVEQAGNEKKGHEMEKNIPELRRCCRGMLTQVEAFVQESQNIGLHHDLNRSGR